MAFELPHLPTKEEILEKATRIFVEEFLKTHPGEAPPTPTEKELKEGSYWDRARRELMSSARSQLEKYLHYLESEAEKIREALKIEKPAPPEERIRELELEVSTLREKYKAARKRLKEAEEEIRRLEEKLRRAPPPPPPKPPVKAPPPKVLPPVPERCPIDGTLLTQIHRIPIAFRLVRPLTAEEEYWRARLGLPVPTGELRYVEIPPTMKVWMCEREHYFERDATGRLVQRTPEFIYRKILRERARLEKIVYPPRVAPPVVPPIYRRPPLPRPVKTQDLWWDWLERVKGISREQYMKLSEAEKKRLIQEWVEYMRRGR